MAKSLSRDNASYNNGSNNLYSVGGDLTDSIKPSSENQLKNVAINSGISHGPVNSTNTWSTMNDTLYGGFNIDSGSDTTKEPSSGSY